MPETGNRNKSVQGGDGCLAVSLQSVPSIVRASDGRDIPFTRARLVISNGCPEAASGLAIRASLGQEGGTVQDVSSALAGTSALAPGGVLNWDVFDVLLPAHQGAASKLHMFGYRAVLNWKFDLSVRAEYRLKGASGAVHAASAGWTLQWTVVNTESGSVGLSITGSTGQDT